MDELKQVTFSWLYNNIINYKKVANPPNTNQLVTKAKLIENYNVNTTLLDSLSNNQTVRRGLVAGVSSYTHRMNLVNVYDSYALSEGPWVNNGSGGIGGELPPLNPGDSQNTETTWLSNLYFFEQILSNSASIELSNFSFYMQNNSTPFFTNSDVISLNNGGYNVFTKANTVHGVNIGFVVNNNNLVIVVYWDTIIKNNVVIDFDLKFNNNTYTLNNVINPLHYQFKNFFSTTYYTNLTQQQKNALNIMTSITAHSSLGYGTLSKK